MSDLDLKAYLFGELPEAERRRVAAHLESDPAAREEFARLERTEALLGYVQSEELPRRIAFVSDKVFEPTLWQRFWASGPQLGFVAASLLALAIVGHGWLTRPVAAPIIQTAKVDEAAVRAVVASEVSARMAEVIRQVSATPNSDQRTAQMIAVAVKQAEKKAEFDRAADRLTFQENFNLMRKLISRDQVASYQRPMGER
ncbi:MAG: zf-HC2 domain-containing protein [Bryobacteraceae bacterium]|nr:zf-HC2 domain-containing protein [Bryobacteraceae bacterium]